MNTWLLPVAVAAVIRSVAAAVPVASELALGLPFLLVSVTPLPLAGAVQARQVMPEAHLAATLFSAPLLLLAGAAAGHTILQRIQQELLQAVLVVLVAALALAAQVHSPVAQVTLRANLRRKETMEVMLLPVEQSVVAAVAQALLDRQERILHIPPVQAGTERPPALADRQLPMQAAVAQAARFIRQVA